MRFYFPVAMSAKVKAAHTSHLTTGHAHTGVPAGAHSDPHDIDEVIERLHIGTLQREKLKVCAVFMFSSPSPPIFW